MSKHELNIKLDEHNKQSTKSKDMRKLLLTLLVTLLSLPVMAFDFQYQGLWFSTLSNTEVEVSRNLWVSGDITIPGKVMYNGIEYSVSSIGDNAFYNCSGLTNVVIGNSVTSIGQWAFEGCSSLTSVIIGNCVNSIGYGAFAGCSGMTSINVDHGNLFFTSVDGILYNKELDTLLCYPGGLKGGFEIPKYVNYIGDNAFNGCSGLTSVEIPNSVTSIGNVAFFGCSGLTSVEIPNSVTSIGNFAFGYSGLTSVKIPNSITTIESSAFSYCSGLTNVVIGNSVTSIGQWAFEGCSSLTSVIIGNCVNSIGYRAFAGCLVLTNVEIPNSVTSIGDQAFAGCSGMTSINVDHGNRFFTSVDGILYNKELDTLLCYPGGLQGEFKIPSYVTSIGNDAFYDCIGLTSIVVGNSVTSIGDRAFYRCYGLKTITFYSITDLSLGSSAFNNCDDIEVITCNTRIPPVADTFYVFSDQVYSNAKLYVPEKQKELYSTTTPWSKFQNIYFTNYTTGEDETVYKIVPVLSLSQTLTLGVKNMDTNELEDSFLWSTSDSYVAEVSSQGIVMAKAVGETVITATNSDGDSAEFEIIVVKTDDTLAVKEILLESAGNSNVYTLGGVIVIRDASQEDLRSLAPGIYIFGGRKVAVKN